MKDERAALILKRLKECFPTPKNADRSRSPFQTLVLTILSQNTNDKNSRKAFQNLSRSFPITPKSLASADEEDIRRAIRVAGLYHNKSKTIKHLAEVVLNNFNGDLTPVLKMPLDQARENLLNFPGVGPKTADVFLLFCGNKPTIPVDTHVFRVSKRLGLCHKDADYEGVRRSLQEIYTPNEYLALHLSLISLGRALCKSRKPACESCPLLDLCPSGRMW